MATKEKKQAQAPKDFDSWTLGGYGIKAERPNGKRKALVRKINAEIEKKGPADKRGAK